MIAVDTNILVYSHREENDFYESAVGCLSQLTKRYNRWAIPWPCIHEFLVVVTNPRIFKKPTPTMKAIAAVESWMESPTCVILGEGPGHLDQLKILLGSAQISGPRIHDAKIAAICLQSGVRELWTADRDFSRFPALKTKNPLI